MAGTDYNLKALSDPLPSFNQEQAVAFLTALYEDMREPQTWQVFDDGPDKKPALSRILYGTFEGVLPRLLEFQKQGAGIYLTINPCDGMGREKHNVTGLRALYIDKDDGTVPPQEWPVPPSLVVRRSDGERWHAYWLIDESEPYTESRAEAFVAAQKQLIAFWKSDGAICYTNCVMRVPGFWHLKDPKKPRMYEIERHAPVCRYTIEQVVAGHPVAAEALKKATTYQHDDSGKILGGKHDTLRNAVAWMRSKGFPLPAIMAAAMELKNHIVGTDARDVPDAEVQRLVEWSGKLDAGPVTFAAVNDGAAIAASLESGRDTAEKQKAVDERRKHFRILGPEEWRMPLPPREWVVEGFAPRGGLGMLVSEPGKGKSLVLVELAEAVALGRSFGGFDTKQGRVLYCAPDSPESSQRRLQGISPEAAAFIDYAPGVSVPLDFARLEREHAALGTALPYSLVIIDTYDRARKHSGDGFASQDALVQEVLGGARDFAYRTGCFVAFAHHTTRADKGRPRGSQSIDGLCDLIANITKMSDHVIAMDCLKMRDGEPFKPIAWDIATREGANPESDWVPYLTDSSDTTLREARKATEIRLIDEKVYAIIDGEAPEHGWTHAAIAKAAGVPLGSLAKILKRLRAKNLIE